MLTFNNSGTVNQELNNASGVNMSLSSPSIEEMNRIISYGAGADDANVDRAELQDPAFGKHIREAVEIGSGSAAQAVLTLDHDSNWPTTAPRNKFHMTVHDAGRCYLPNLDNTAEVLAFAEGEQFKWS
jgi:hypothetical protein